MLENWNILENDPHKKLCYHGGTTPYGLQSGSVPCMIHVLILMLYKLFDVFNFLTFFFPYFFSFLMLFFLLIYFLLFPS